MADNVAPEEAEALQAPLEEALSTQNEVLQRDFRRPMRMSAGQLGDLRALLQGSLASIDEFVGSALGEGTVCDLDDVSEVNAESILPQLSAPLAAARFSVGGQPGWATWQIGQALAAIGFILGEEPPEKLEERSLSHVEKRILQGFFTGIVDAILGVFEAQLEGLALAREPYELGTWRDGDPAQADSHRLCVGIAIDGPVPRSVLRIYLPGFQSTGVGINGSAQAALPQHLAPVDVRIHALLGRCDIPLADLMALEEGDVIPLDGEAGRVQLTVENQACAHGRLGQRHGKYALRLDEIVSRFQPQEDES